MDAGGGTATSGTDYTAITTTTLSWANGDSSAKTFDVAVIADGSVESDETVNLALGNVTGATLGTPTSATVTIVNDDAAVPGTLQFSLANYSVAEDGSGTATITVTRAGGSTGAVGVSYATSNGTATAGSDYTAVSSTLSWADGISTAQTFDVPITNDTDVEVPETVNLTLSNPTGGATLGTPNTATLTIISEDKYGTIKFSATSYNVDEVTNADVTDVITLQRVDGSSGIVSVDVTDLGTGTATGSGTDYTFTSPTTVSWADGETMDKNVTITLVDDAVVEVTETVNLSLGNVTGGARIGSPSTATVNIADDDSSAAFGDLQFDAATYSVDEGAGTATITVNRINGTSGAVGVSYATSNETATAGSDYETASGTLSWADGVGGAKTFTVAITNDTDVEGSETVNLTLSTPTGGAILVAPSTAILTINDNDTNLTMDIGDGTYWVAFQDGSGSWTEWSPTSGNTYNFPVTDGNGRYGVAFHQQESDSVNTVEKTYVIHATIGELASLDAFSNERFSVSGTLSNRTGSNDSAFAVMYVTGDGGLVGDPYAYTIPQVPAGNRDLLAIEEDTISQTPGNFVIRRKVPVTGDLQNQDVDFSSSEAEALTHIEDIDFFGSSPNQLLEVYYSTANGTSIEISSETYDGVNPTKYGYLTNTSLTQAGDSYSFQISNSTGSKYRIRNRAATDGNPGTQTMGLGSLASLTGTAVNAIQTTGLSYTYDPTSFMNPVFRVFQIDLDQTVVGIDGGAHWQIKISAGWLGATTTYMHPSLSSISGFNPTWNMISATQTHATVSAATSNNGTGLSLIIRKTMGRSSNNLDESTWVVPKKLAQNDSLKLDIANQTSTFSW
jgi:hypothetical protein